MFESAYWNALWYEQFFHDGMSTNYFFKYKSSVLFQNCFLLDIYVEKEDILLLRLSLTFFKKPFCFFNYLGIFCKRDLVLWKSRHSNQVCGQIQFYFLFSNFSGIDIHEGHTDSSKSILEVIQKRVQEIPSGSPAS